MYLLVYVTWYDGVMSRDNYLMKSNSCHLGFQNFSKTSENFPKLLKSTYKR